MSRTAIATWLSRPIMGRLHPYPPWSAAARAHLRRARSHLEHVHVAGGLLVPRGRERGADRLPERLGDGFGIAPAPTRHRLEGLDRRVISDVLDAVSQRIGLGNAGQPHVGIADQLAAPADGKRNRNHPGKTKPAAIGNGALLSADDERAVFVEPTGGPRNDLFPGARAEPHQFPPRPGNPPAVPRPPPPPPPPPPLQHPPRHR